MDTRQNPFSVYDFLGYMIPGAFLIYTGIILYPLLGSPFSHIFTPPDTPLLQYPYRFIPLTIAAYLLGHLLSFLSSMSVEKYAIWSFGYPSRFLLNVRPNSYIQTNAGAAYPNIRRALRVSMWIFCFPFSTLDFLLERLVKVRELYAKDLDPQLIAIIKRKVFLYILTESGIAARCEDAELKREHYVLDLKKTDFFRILYHYVLEKYPHHVIAIKNYVALYGFLRAMTLICVALFWVGFTRYAVFLVKSIQLGPGNIPMFEEKYFALVALVVMVWLGSYIFFMAFVKFYRRYTLEVYMAMAAHYTQSYPKSLEDNWCDCLLKDEPTVETTIAPESKAGARPSTS